MADHRHMASSARAPARSCFCEWGAANVRNSYKSVQECALGWQATCGWHVCHARQGLCHETSAGCAHTMRQERVRGKVSPLFSLWRRNKSQQVAQTHLPLLGSASTASVQQLVIRIALDVVDHLVGRQGDERVSFFCAWNQGAPYSTLFGAGFLSGAGKGCARGIFVSQLLQLWYIVRCRWAVV